MDNVCTDVTYVSLVTYAKTEENTTKTPAVLNPVSSAHYRVTGLNIH